MRNIPLLFLFSQTVFDVFYQTAGSDAEQVFVQPVVTQYFFDDGIVADSLFCRADTTGNFDTDTLSCDGMVLFQNLAHRVNGFRSCAGIAFPGRCLDEVRTGIEGENCRFLNTFGCLESTCFEDDFQFGITTALFDLLKFFGKFVIVFFEEIA